METLVWRRSSIGATLQPLGLRSDFLAGEVPHLHRLRVRKPACRIVTRSPGTPLEVRAASSSFRLSDSGGDQVFRADYQVLQAPQEVSESGEVRERREFISKATGRRGLIAATAAVFASSFCACCFDTVRFESVRAEPAVPAPGQVNVAADEKSLLARSAAPAPAAAQRPAAAAAAQRPAEVWDYGGLSGPERWGAVCAEGVRQSPIDFETDKVKEINSEDLIFDYNLSAPTFLNTGHGTMQVNFSDRRNRIRIGDKIYDLLQLHFHTPSEHSFNGTHFSMEGHLVHRDPESNTFAVVGVMLDAKRGSLPNMALQAALDFSPVEHKRMVQGPKNFKMTPALILPNAREREKRGYFHYTGSLTTPPCAENVEWYVMETPVSVSSLQVLDFMKYVGDFHTYSSNTRPVQPLGDRVVEKGYVNIEDSHLEVPMPRNKSAKNKPKVSSTTTTTTTVTGTTTSSTTTTTLLAGNSASSTTTTTTAEN